MTDRHVDFRPYQVRAALAGRLSQTRRIIKPSPEFCGGGRSRDPQNWNDPDAWGWENYDEGCWDLLSEGYTGRPFYAPGDRLWVREAWASDGMVGVRYYATDDVHELRRKRSPIHMPRWASRLTLLVTDVRVQRLQEISAEDVTAEGIPFESDALAPYEFSVSRFADLWNSIHGPEAWDANPWVAAISFETHRCNIDTMEEGTW